LLVAHEQLLHGLRLESGYGAEQFGQLIELTLMQLAEYVYILPATRSENHSDSGGLLRLAIEAATLAFRRAEGQFLNGPVCTDVRNRERDRIWRYAIFLGALLRPVGRCCTSFRVLAASEQAWNPHQEGLWPFLKRVNARDLDLQWRDSTDARPEQASSVWIAARLLTPAALTYLALAGEQAVEMLVQMLMGARVGRACEIVEEAHQAAIDRDLQRLGRAHEAGALGIPIEHRILDAIRTLIREKWTLNTPGARLWVTSRGVFLAWKSAVTDIGVKLRADGVAGAPRDPDTLAEVLLARGILVPNAAAVSSLKHYHRFVPQMRGIPKQPIEAVKFADLAMVGLSAEGVEPVEVELVSTRLDAEVGAPVAKAPARVANTRGPRVNGNTSKVAAALPGTMELPFAPTPADAQRRTVSTSEPPPVMSSPVAALEGPSPSGLEGPKQPASPVASTDSTEQSPRATMISATPKAGASQAAASHPGLARLAQFGEAGPALRALGERLLNEPGLPGVVSTPEGVALSYPHAIALFCPEPQRFLTACESQGLLIADKSPGGGLVRQRGPDRTLPEHYVVLSPRVARYLPTQPVITSDVSAS
jgi:hypothetical protein